MKNSKGEGYAIFSQIKPLCGVTSGEHFTINNAAYWMGSTVVTARGVKSKFRNLGRVWSFDCMSADICSIEWSGP
ncbi:MAG: hypothetical protein ACPGGK_02930 [Pikeienuella sp.]